VRKTLCALISFSIILILLASCSQPQETTSRTSAIPSSLPATTALAKTTPATQPTTAPPATKPEYGGQIVLGFSVNVGDFDEVYGFFGPPELNTMQLTNEELFVGDWAKGPAGTDETDYSAFRTQFETGQIAESWDFSQLTQGTMVFKIRKGIHFALNPASEASRLVAGRELNAEDVVFSLKQAFTNPRSYLYTSYPDLRTAEITAPDKWTVKYVCAPGSAANALTRVIECCHIVPPEVVQKYGNMIDWHNSAGSGPFMITDFVDNSSVSFVKNPNYWAKDPAGPGKGNQLPYADRVTALIIPDVSTRQAAMRTGRIDTMGGLNWEDGPALMKQVPGVQYMKKGRSSAMFVTGMRTDKAPFNDVRVRRALLMAMDFDAINKGLFGSDALILTWPIGYFKAFNDAYLALDDPECPATVKELYTYNPEKAKQLLKEAGFPNGFKTNVVYGQSDTTVNDYYSIIKQMWTKVGVDLVLDPRENAVWTSIYRARSFDQIGYGSCAPITVMYQCGAMWGESLTNISYVKDARIDQARTQMMALSLTDTGKADAIHKDLLKYVLDQAWAIPYPSPATYSIWQPWLKNYYATSSVGYMNGPNWVQWAWVDQTLKKSMGH
jgi:peptide/nickel transport system substrate-binding protein